MVKNGATLSEFKNIKVEVTSLFVLCFAGY